MPILDKTAILGADDLKRETVSVPEWGGDVIVQEMTAKARLEWSTAAYTVEKGKTAANPETFMAALLVVCCVGEDGEPLFSSEDMPALARKSGAAVERVAGVAMRLNGMSAKSEDEGPKKN